MIGVEDVEAAQKRIADRVRHTPVIALDQLQRPVETKASVNLKLELLQVTGSFKARGAMNCFLGLPKETVRNGLVAASGGNHGLLHSGGRYAATDTATAAECRIEGEILKRVAPQCIDDCGGLPVRIEHAPVPVRRLVGEVVRHCLERNAWDGS